MQKLCKMSEQTKRAIEDALQAHLEDEDPGAIVTGYVILISNLTPHDLEMGDSTHYYAVFPQGQPYHSSLGLSMKLQDIISDTDEE